MKNTIIRIVAFICDVILINLVVVAISLFSFFNPNIDELKDNLDNIYTISSDYQKANDALSDKIISQKEMEKELGTFKSIFKDVKVDKKIKEKEVNNLIKNINEVYTKKTNEIGYKNSKASVYTTIYTIIASILYFGVIQWFFKGQTLFKMIFRLKVENINDPETRVSLGSFLLRSILVCEIIFALLDLVFLFDMNQSSYIGYNATISQVRMFYELAFIVVLIMSNSNRSIHDFILNTKVVRYNKSGEVIENTSVFNEEKVEEIKEVKEAPKKKKTTSKKSQKETVKAEKVDD